MDKVNYIEAWFPLLDFLFLIVLFSGLVVRREGIIKGPPKGEHICREGPTGQHAGSSHRSVLTLPHDLRIFIYCGSNKHCTRQVLGKNI